MAANLTTRRVVAALIGAAALMVVGSAQQAARPDTEIYRQLPWRFIGPEGNRFSAVAGIAGDPDTYYVGAASGGIYKTTDAGAHWQSIFDAQPVASIGSLAVAASDPNVVWAGTGEAHIRSHISVGQGIYKSTDAGKTWSLMGLEQTGRIARVAIDPKNPDMVVACALGHAYGPQPDRGVFRTTDGGKTWAKTLFVDENTGCSDIAMDLNNPRIMFAGMWQIEIHTWGRTSGGPGSGLFMSHDGGATWKKLGGHGLPTKPVGKVAVAISDSNPNRIYALIETGDGMPWDGKETDAGEVFRSDDGGENWKVVSYDHLAMGRAHYYSRMAVAPDNENEAYFLTASFSTTIDGGQTLTAAPRGQAPGGDHHDIWIDPTNANRMIVGHDQGLSISINRGRTWLRQRLTNAQMYHVTTDTAIPYNVLGNKQDEPSYRGPSNSRLANPEAGIPRGMWHSIGGGESGWGTPDPTDPNIIWSTASGSGMVGGIVVRFDESRRQFRNVEVWPDQSDGPAEGVKYRFVWDAPFLISPQDHNTLYVGSQYVHRTTDGGQTWEIISPDLTLNDRSRMKNSGGLTPDNIGVEYAGVVYGLAESPRERGLIWAGTNDGLLQLTRDGGKSWTNVTKNMPNLPPWGSVRSIVASRYDAGTAYVAVDFHQVNNRDPFVYKTTDYGKSFRAITNGIPRSMLSYAHVICEDPVRRGLLYLGTENAIYVSFDDGDNWQALQNNLPHAPVYGITVQEHFDDLVIGTYGRGFWIMDDLTPLQQLTPQVLASDAHLFPPRPAYRFRPITAPSTPYDDPTIGQNPPYGASINYYLKSAAAAPVKVTILNQAGETVRTLTTSGRAGINRIYWDLRYEASNDIRLRTSPLAPAPQLRLNAEGWRPVPGGGTQLSILAPPGTYTVKLSAGGRDLTAPLTVLKDPNSAGTEADIAEQTRMMFDLRRDLDTAVDGANRMESLRSQIGDLIPLVDDASIKKAAEQLNRQFTDLEMTLIDLRLTGAQDTTRYAAALISRIGYLAGGLSSGDFKPTSQQVEVQKLLAERVRNCVSQLDALLAKDLAAFNGMLRAKNIPNIIAAGAKGGPPK
jgi:photosystem II stability/assembly factor-like uncharacterized protein